MTKHKTAKLDIAGEQVDVGIPKDLLADLGGMVYFGALALTATDKGSDEAALYCGATMVEFIKRCLREVKDKRAAEPESYMAWATVLDWVIASLDIDEIVPESQSDALTALVDRLRQEGG